MAELAPSLQGQPAGHRPAPQGAAFRALQQKLNFTQTQLLKCAPERARKNTLKKKTKGGEKKRRKEIANTLTRSRYIYYEKVRTTKANLIAGFGESSKLLST